MFSWSDISDEILDFENTYPKEISILPLRGTVGLPNIIMPLVMTAVISDWVKTTGL